MDMIKVQRGIEERQTRSKSLPQLMAEQHKARLGNDNGSIGNKDKSQGISCLAKSVFH
jgi:hypothetical protein